MLGKIFRLPKKMDDPFLKIHIEIRVFLGLLRKEFQKVEFFDEKQ